MNIEQNVSNFLNKSTTIKRLVKRTYQVLMYVISPKIKSEGNIVRVTPKDEFEYFFGYYDKSPWDITERYLLCLQVKETYKDVAPKDTAKLVIIDTQENNKIKIIGESKSWNVQQGCMLQWLGPKFKNEIIYNDFRNNKYCSVIKNIFTGEERVIEKPVYSVSPDGKFALSLDFSRLHRLRKGYGYSNLKDDTSNEKLPNKGCIWKIDLKTGLVTELLKYTDFFNFEHRIEMDGAEHKVNHIMINPSGEKFMVLHRWIKGSRKYTRLITCDCDGSNMYNLSDDDMVSHCTWKNNCEILAYENKKNSGRGYYLMKDNTKDYVHLWENLNNDGHPSYSPDRKLVVTDTYPDRARISRIKILKKDKIKVVASVFNPFKYDNDIRCDLHPRWNRSGTKICFDSVFEGKRELYIANLKTQELKPQKNEGDI